MPQQRYCAGKKCNMDAKDFPPEGDQFEDYSIPFLLSKGYERYKKFLTPTEKKETPSIPPKPRRGRPPKTVTENEG